MQSDTLDIIDTLEDLIDKERAAILAGALDEVSRLSIEKEQVMGQQALAACNPETLDRLRKKTARNQQLLTAAIRGVRSVMSRLNILRNGPGEMNTYDQSGQRTTLNSGHNGALHRRA